MSTPETAAEASAATETLAEASMLDQILMETKLRPTDEGYDVARRGVAAFVSELVKPARGDEKVNSAIVDQMIAAIDQKLSAQLDAIMHADSFQQLESSWRGLKFLVDRTDFRQNIRVELLSVAKDDLLADFDDSPE